MAMGGTAGQKRNLRYPLGPPIIRRALGAIPLLTGDVSPLWRQRGTNSAAQAGHLVAVVFVLSIWPGLGLKGRVIGHQFISIHVLLFVDLRG